MSKAPLSADELHLRYHLIDKYRDLISRRYEDVIENIANIKKIYFDHEEELVVLRSESSEDFSPIYISPNDEWDGLISGTVIQVIKGRAPVSV